jgi:hypothetical protein
VPPGRGNAQRSVALRAPSAATGVAS